MTQRFANLVPEDLRAAVLALDATLTVASGDQTGISETTFAPVAVGAAS